MNDGMLMLDWAKERPQASVNTPAKSLDSRTRVEKEARLKVAAASSTMEINLAQWISREIGSKAERFRVISKRSKR